MNKIIIAVLSMMLLTVASCVDKPKNNNSSNQVEKEKKTIALNKIEFLKRVVNYEENPDEWKYLGDKPAIVDFYADWCPPCKIVSPILEELAEKYEGEIYIYKVDVDREQELASVFKIQSIPTLLFIPMEGDPQETKGAIPMEAFEKGIREILLKQ